MRDGNALASFIEKWLYEKVHESKAKGIVVGLSGGIDSAVVAGLGRRALGDNVQAVIMPCHSDPQDAKDARLVANTLDITCITINLTPAFDALCTEGVFTEEAKANLKARLRMATLYATAQTRGFVVCGTSNRSEFETGYFTKFGDSASDLLPLADLLKCEVRAVAAVIGVPQCIIDKPPSAGLAENQTDEGDMGVSYAQLDCYLATGVASEEVRERIETLRRRSEHKRIPVPICRPIL